MVPTPILKRVLIALALIVFGGLGGAIVVGHDDQGNTTITVRHVATSPLAVTPPSAEADSIPQTPAVEKAAASAAKVTETDLVDEGVGETPLGSDLIPLATPTFPGCRTRLLDNNWSYRNGATFKGFGFHYTVSSSVPGWADVDGVTTFFNQLPTLASSNLVYDTEAHCNYIVPFSQKAWTQGNLNPEFGSVEIIARGDEARLLDANGLRGLARIAWNIHRLYGLPLRIGALSGCSVTQPGFFDHNMLGCGNNHHDITPFTTPDCSNNGGHIGKDYSSAPCIETILRMAAEFGKPPKPQPTARDIARCGAVLRFRQRRTRGEHPPDVKLERQRTRLGLLHKAHVTRCTPTVVKRAA